MRKRNVHIQFWLDKMEAEAFQKKVKKSGLSREAYIVLVNCIFQIAKQPIFINRF